MLFTNKLLHNFASSFLTLSMCASFAFASVDVETEGMEVAVRGDGTFLISSPTYYFDRIQGAGGIHSESELWNPSKLRERLLLNRFSITPSWNPLAPSIWVRTGNEVGDMIYQDALYDTDERPDNRTPLLEGGFRTPSFMGFWATARLFQVDHYSNENSRVRRRQVSDEFSFFGANWPMFSTLYGGLGFTNDFIDASVLAGEEYLWIFGESSRWIPVFYSPRVEARADIGNLEVTLAYENAEYQNVKKKESGTRTEVNGSVYYKCGSFCKEQTYWFAAGAQFRKVEDEGTVYFGLEDDYVAWPFVQMQINLLDRITLDAMIGANNRDWLLQDSLELKIPIMAGLGVVVGEKNIAGTRLNPLADTEEFFDGDTMNLAPNGSMQLHELYLMGEDSVSVFRLGARAAGWVEYGAESFDTTEFVKDDKLLYRHGDVSRINEWIEGVTGKAWFAIDYGKMFSFTAMGGFERIWGPTREFEVTPAEYFASFEGDWLLGGSIRIAHSINYRSDARWNLRSSNPMVIKGDWYWNATFEQQFPKYGLFLTGSLLHVLADEALQAPNGSYDRLRFICTVRKTF